MRIQITNMKTGKNPTKKTSMSKATFVQEVQNLYTIDFDAVQNAQAKMPGSLMFHMCKNLHPPRFNSSECSSPCSHNPVLQETIAYLRWF